MMPSLTRNGTVSKRPKRWLEAIFEHASAALAVVTTGGVFQEVNQRFCDLLNCSRERLLSTTLPEVIAQPGLMYRTELQNLLRGEQDRCTIETGGQLGQGEAPRLAFQFSLLPSWEDSAERTLVVTAEDRAFLDTEHQKSEEKFAKAFECSPHPFTLGTLEDDRLFAVNAAFEEVTGYTREEVLGRKATELGLWRDPKLRAVLVERISRGERIRNVECQFQNRNGDPVVGLLSAELIELNGEQCVLANVIDITEWRRTEEALRLSQKRSSLYVQQTMFGVIEWDRDFRAVEWNPAAEEIFGFTRDEAVGRPPKDFIVPKEIVPDIDAVFRSVLSQTEPRISINENITKSGKRIICEWFNSPLIDENGRVFGEISLVHDVTAQKHSEVQLRESQAILSALFESTEDMIWVVDPQQFGLTMFNSGLRRYFAQQRGIELSHGMTPEQLLPTPEQAELWKEFYRKAIGQGAFMQEYDVAAGTHILDLGFYPLVRDGEVFGISVFGRDVTARRSAERALRKSEDRFRHLVAASHDWVWEIDAGLRYTHVGPQCRETLGYEPEEILGKTPLDFMLPDEAARISEIIEQNFRQRKSFQNLENTRVHKSGLSVILETTGIPVLDDNGEVLGYQGVSRDITERKRAEIALRESESRYRTLASNLPGAVFQFYATDEGQWGFHFVHENCCDLLGIEAEPLDSFGARFAACLDPEDERRRRESIRQAISTEGMWDFETKFKKPSGEEIYVRGVSRPRRYRTELVYHGILLDITPRKLAEKALRDSEERLHLAAQAGRMYAFEWDANTDLITRSQECVDILGLGSAITKSRRDEIVLHMYPADREQYEIALKRVTAEAPEFRIGYRVSRADGSMVWLEDRVRAFFDANGQISRTLGMTADISARKEAELAVSELSGRLINAQEEERKRLARELHDGISQELAVISIELSQASKAVAPSDTSDKLEATYEKVQNVLTEIGGISHRLHPSTLRHLGLAAALKALCRDISDTSPIDVTYHAERLPVLPKEVELCFYRIAQEALHNVVKHSGATRAAVELEAGRDKVMLVVRDDGNGFDVSQAAGGLGLVSMRERLRMLNGELKISSEARRGTRIEAHVPLQPPRLAE